jgi:hypothetical protein
MGVRRGRGSRLLLWRAYLPVTNPTVREKRIGVVHHVTSTRIWKVSSCLAEGHLPDTTAVEVNERYWLFKKLIAINTIPGVTVVQRY